MDTPKYAVVQEWIKNEINKGHYKDGEKIHSENELMAKFNFSRQTIRLAIANLEAQGYLEKIKGSGTYVRMSNTITEKESHIIGVILNDFNTFTHSEILRGIDKVLTKHNYNISLGITYNKFEKETHVLNSMIENNVDALIVEGCKTAVPSPNKEIYKQIKEKIPCLFINGCNKELDMPIIAVDDVEAGTMATDYLISMGHKNIAAILKSDDIQGHKRYEGYVNSLIKANINVNDNNIMWYNTEDSDDIFDIILKQVFFKRFINCSAVICYNDTIAKKFINLLTSVDIKPFDDISIISFGNSHVAQSLNITSVNQPTFDLGVLAAENCLKLIKANEISTELLKPELVMRNSVHRRSFVSSWGDYSDMTYDNILDEY